MVAEFILSKNDQQLVSGHIPSCEKSHFLALRNDGHIDRSFSAQDNTRAEKRLTGGHCIIDILPEVDSSKFDSVDELSAHCRKIMQCHREKLDAEAANLNR
ncbi:hypothetical protein CAEBREN_11132 [Caenorhabditis brenneri]|uniref:Uncharacterized protein n=1 Tax=Caenorhabditis brenneri TaxID=135651 RepID=G0MH34_CAEBE|nr:hypothetical protein CAEBREN_11132 [Caenorhabditis brenneri]